MKPSQIAAILTKLIPRREPVLVVGSPGCGKTDTVSQVAAALDHELIITHPVVDDPTDYKGMPAVVGKGADASAQFLPFGDLWRMIEAKVPTIVFMDDLGQAPNGVQAAVMQLILARRINGHMVSDQVVFLAATNRRQDKAGVQGLITPLLDRFTTVLTMDFDIADWITWGIDNDMPHDLLAFANFRADLFNKFEASKDMKKQPTARSIAGLGRLVAAGIDDYEVMAGAAGEGFATEYLAFHRTFLELPSKEEIYLNPNGVVVPTKPDVLYALMGSLAHGAEAGNFEQTLQYLSRVKPEFRVLCVKDAMQRTPALAKTHAFTKFAVANKVLFGASK